jgi:large subunit ribosomal protein L13
MATQIATLLMGKNKPIYTQSNNCGDYVVVKNARHILVSGRKEKQKTYFSHSGYPGGAKFTPFQKLRKEYPSRIIIYAVKGMLPKNNLRERMLNRLKVFPDESHPYTQNFTKDITMNFPERSTDNDMMHQADLK